MIFTTSGFSQVQYVCYWSKAAALKKVVFCASNRIAPFRS